MKYMDGEKIDGQKVNVSRAEGRPPIRSGPGGPKDRPSLSDVLRDVFEKSSDFSALRFNNSRPKKEGEPKKDEKGKDGKEDGKDGERTSRRRTGRASNSQKLGVGVSLFSMCGPKIVQINHGDLQFFVLALGPNELRKAGSNLAGLKLESSSMIITMISNQY